ncbi:MAG: type II toxin-antitoxin system Phd/YefM family antitoxin [Candidatus Omnitrophota bacterium]|jgi:prevent-host-death family protein
MIAKTLPLTELKPKLSKVISRVTKYFDRYIITRHGKRVAVILSKKDYDGLLETLDIVSDIKLVKDLKKAEEDLRSGKRISWEKAKFLLCFRSLNTA